MTAINEFTNNPSQRVMVNIVPVPKPRMTQSDRWKKRPAVLRYHAFKDELRSQIKGTLESSFEVVFYMPMPASWSAKKRMAMDGAPHQQRPDVDNLCKALMDALCEEDSHIYRVTMSKYWSIAPGIAITESLSAAPYPLSGSDLLADVAR